MKYKQMNASVKSKKGKQILESSLRSVSNMLTRKINAVKCIHATAEDLARNFNYTYDKSVPYDYCSAKYSKFFYEDENDDPDPNSEEKLPKYVLNSTHYTNVSLEKDSHFYNINVNTNTSCVHVPTNIFDEETNARNAILWSKGLNDIFLKNYNSDPSLSWQYFGSSHGILRFYPGMRWNTKEVDTYDCRVMSWYIEAATCSKDMIILFDVSGSMTGFKNYVARRTLRSLLDTLSNNDYVNVYTFKNTTNFVVDCFLDLVQATPENLQTLTDTLEPTDEGKTHKVPLEGYANLTTAYIKAFTALKKRRDKCNVSSTQGCNQLVMVITDYVPGNLTEVFEEYNREVIGGKTFIPVRVFTYLIGKEVTNVREIQWMACLNRGYFVHIHSVEEVQQQVLKYINVIARPMILENKEPPPTWTHANIDSTRTNKWGVSGDISKPDEDKLVTSVAIPAFDYKYNEENNDALLLGVAGTDVPIDSIAKLAKPHQLGVNGYSFIVSNNGYLLLHPLLTTTINNDLQKNYNSVDFVEVEQVDDGKGTRDLGDQIKNLRNYLVEGVDGNMTQVPVLYHYDNMRRIARVSHDYFFNKLEGTPFSMGISLPKGYGDTELLLKENPLEAKQGKELTGINVTDYFRYSFRVHPDWVYCKYHYLEGHESSNSEEEAWKFLVGLSKNEIDITKQQYPENENKTKTFSLETHCGMTPLGKDDYYCNEDLVKQLVFDAKLSAPYFENWIATDEQWDLARKYNVSVRFIATSSGLTRWHYVFDSDKNEEVDDHGNRRKGYDGDVFGDIYHNTIEETWYKAAVLQHMINKESLVVATPLPVLDDIIKNPPKVINEDGDITLTASYAIFYKDETSETPASVVGFQYSYLKFYERFLEITNISIDGSKDPTCDPNSEKYDCYVIDSSGYIVLAKEKEIIGQFFGTVQKHVLQSFLELGIYDHVEVFNYQALCPLSALIKKSNSWTLRTPFSLAFNFFHWLVTEALLLLSNLYNPSEYAYAAVVDDQDYIDLINHGYTEAPTTTASPLPENETVSTKDEEEESPFSCDHSITLFILNQKYFLDAAGASPVVQKDEAGDCWPAYWAAYVPKTNLLLVVVEKHDDFAANCTEPPDTKPQPTVNSTTSREPCHKLKLGALHRRRLEGCYTYHDGSFKSAQVESRDGEKLVQSMSDDIRAMMELKISAVKRIVEAAENMAFDKQNEPVPEDFQFYNSKEMEEPWDEVSITTTPETDFGQESWIVRPPTKSAHTQQNPHFSNIPVNTNFSSVHVPTNVYAWALKWRADPVDIYDCRTRAWYMEAAASPKDVIILVDRSGSMTGQRRDIAKHVVTNILDTLGNNDFVNVMTFADTVEEIVPCFEDSLVQATLGNLRELKLAMDNFETQEIANFSAALTRAFELLEIYRNNSGGANCNQAIMLVTDGVPYNYKEIFEKYNWKYDTPVRVFTYLIGREVADVREVKWMACANRGFYVHLSTLAEVRERVLEHVNVLARPLVLQREKHPVVWTPVYANVTDPKVADYLWEQRERAEQKERFMSQRRDKNLFNSDKEQDRRWRITQMKQGQYSELGNSQYQLMTSVSMPVYDLRHNEIGVNGYAFIVTNNGYILIHPDLRPVFQQILKPSYNSVDMIEVELFDDDRGPRNFSKELTALRKEIIDQKTGNKVMSVKYHLDDMKRVSRAKRHYFWTGISDSPFTLVVAIPENYGRHRITPPPTDDIHRLSLTSKNISARQYLSDKWSVHPDWLYCRHYERTFANAEEELLYFLERVAKPGWRWPAKPRPPEHHKNKPGHERHNNGTPEARERNKVSNSTPRNEYYCDHGLMQALVYDARNTAWFNKSISESASDEKAVEFIQRFGYIVAFLSTHSGLTRWQTHPPKEHDNDKPEFGKQWPRAIEEVWYRRAVEQHYVDPLSYVYSVDLSTDKFPLNVSLAMVTASHAVFHGDGHRKAPAAVVGFQFKHERLSEWFDNITSSCEHNKECTTCQSDSWDCYLVDNNGWIIVSEDSTQTGQFFGRIRPDIMARLVEDEVYKAVHIVDYQAVCFREKKTTNPATMLFTPLENLRLVMAWFIATTVWFYNCITTGLAQASSYSLDDENVTPTAYQSYENDEETDDPSMSKPPNMRVLERDYEKLVLINRTRPTPCDREMYLYQLTDYSNLDAKLNKPMTECSRPFYAQHVNYTNMLMIVVDANCPKEEVAAMSVDATEVNYNESLPCLKHMHPLYRKQPTSCIRNHSEESNIDMCGRGSLPGNSKTWVTLSLFLILRYLA
ncbi:unnamed protein product [Spodoptera exigua]|nr:unnamed protein product [Spodoptera exigua]